MRAALPVAMLGVIMIVWAFVAFLFGADTRGLSTLGVLVVLLGAVLWLVSEASKRKSEEK